MSFDPLQEITKLRGSWPYIKAGNTGWWVRLLQRALRIHGYDIGVDGMFGPGITIAVRRFQRDNNLTMDGVVGPQTWFALSHEPHTAITPIQSSESEEQFVKNADYSVVRSRIVAIAQGLRALNVRERGNNRGEVVDALNMHARGLVGIPWCAAFADFCTDTAYESTGLEKPFDVGVSSSAIWRHARDLELLRDTSAARPGDLFLVPGGSTGWQHTGIIIGWEGHNLITIEGNTDLKGDSEGQGIFQRKRNPVYEKLAIVSVTD